MTWAPVHRIGAYPRVVALGGGHGLAATLRATRTYAGQITAVVSVADDGGSTGRLRAAEDRAAPGDLRKCLVALAHESSVLARAMNYRFVAGELDGHAFGNLLIVALEDTQGDLVAALDQVGELLGAVGRVLPTTQQAVTLHASITSGDVVHGEQVVGSRSDVSHVSLSPHNAQACPEAVQAILEADQILLGPGSLYTSVLAATAVTGIAEALEQSRGQFVYVCNLNPQIPETVGYGVVDHVRALER
ncbi:MAG: uridine diphosphate-N-acetylglucosamine-binding protein YvcK, partial [Microthrixaceae bacterium]